MESHAEGFTLVELMIVVVIITLLATIAIPKFATLVRKANEGASKGSLGSIRGALSIYYSDMEGVYPSDLTSLTIEAKYMQAIPLSKTPSYHWDSSSVVNGAVSTDAGGWLYDNIQADAADGSVWVNCTHTDTKGSVWTSY
ncbi:MAG: prepilin-type N-terminal cleavage/methylation domain-containing protein [Elusimicrobia bacterium]|nr:prepilin-type N-terminal cleavage/methylation domain-containing protein [Elusimicrobiota bacterium]MDE2236831.1 prepilin-type N-terminal cleavage/methylation domain-containing protein [Elusimicrobiota bacterium]MDE2424740.1 prepilin-type N-terminal cleavage/methylation domain-containing protein [Elusimicrobiota bacterium]